MEEMEEMERRYEKKFGGLEEGRERKKKRELDFFFLSLLS